MPSVTNSITRHTFARHSLHAFVCPPRRPRSPPRRPRFPSPVALAPLPAALASPPRRPRFPSPSPSLPLPVALASPPRRPRFPTPSPSLPLPVALASPPRRPRFPSPSPSLPVSVALASPPRRPRFPSPSPSLPLPVTLASPASAVSLALAPPARNPHLPIHLRMVESAGLFADYLASLPAAQLDRLYSSLYTCQAVLRSLPPLAKQYVLRLLFLTDPVPAALVADWPKPEAHSKHKAALDRLQQLRLLLACSETGSLAAAASSAPAAFRLNPTFQQQLQQALTSGAPVSRPSVPATRLPSAAELAAHATSHWEAVLMHLISPPSIAGGHGAAVITRVLVRAGLLTHSGSSLSVVSTSAFPFLLKDRNEQLWAIVSSYIESAQDRGHDSGDVIAFLLELGFHNVGTPYSMTTLTSMQQEVVEEIAQLGFVLTQKGRHDQWFIPTHLAAALSSSLSESATSDSEGFIVVETNFRVYAYTQSKLQAEILSLFM
ncbi:unnamed protein product, partial [Closterium sp. NIES-64]